MTMPSWVLFDLNGTLLDPRPVASALPVADGEAVVLAPLHDAGLHAGVLTNSGKAPALRALESAGLVARIERVIASDAVRAYKPATSVYQAAAEQIGVPPAEIVLVSAHWWDVTGAKRVGLGTAWVSAKEQVLMPGSPAPDVQGPSLLDVAQGIVNKVGERKQ
jgi:2-haloacid dehalogenase